MFRSRPIFWFPPTWFRTWGAEALPEGRGGVEAMLEPCSSADEDDRDPITILLAHDHGQTPGVISYSLLLVTSSSDRKTIRKLHFDVSTASAWSGQCTQDPTIYALWLRWNGCIGCRVWRQCACWGRRNPRVAYTLNNIEYSIKPCVVSYVRPGSATFLIKLLQLRRLYVCPVSISWA